MQILQFMLAKNEYDSMIEKLNNIIADKEYCCDKENLIYALNSIDRMYELLEITQQGMLKACNPKYCDERSTCENANKCPTLCIKKKVQLLLHEAECEYLEKKESQNIK